MDDGVDRQGGRTVSGVDHQFADTAGQNPTGCHGADRRIIGVIAAQQAAQLKRENVGRAGERDVVRERIRDLEHPGRRTAGGQRVGTIGGGRQLRDLAGTEVGLIGGETTLPRRADALRSIIGRVVSRVGDRPGAEITAADRGRRRREDDAARIAQLTEIRTGKVDGRVIITCQRRELQDRRVEISRTRIDVSRDRVRT